MPASQFFCYNCFIKIDRPIDDFLVFFCHSLSPFFPKAMDWITFKVRQKPSKKKIIEAIRYYKLGICEEDKGIRPILKALVLP